MDESARDLPGFALSLLQFESVDEFHGGEEANPLLVVLDGLDAERRGDVSLAGAGAGTADEDDVVGVVEELASVKLANERLVNLAAGEVEAIEGLRGNLCNITR